MQITDHKQLPNYKIVQVECIGSKQNECIVVSNHDADVQLIYKYSIHNNEWEQVFAFRADEFELDLLFAEQFYDTDTNMLGFKGIHNLVMICKDNGKQTLYPLKNIDDARVASFGDDIHFIGSSKTQFILFGTKERKYCNKWIYQKW